MWLTCEVVEPDDKGTTRTTQPKAGTPQGGVISPLLSNVYLHWFEYAFHLKSGPHHWASAKIVRYADDFVILARYQGPFLVSWIENTLESRFNLTLNREKTKIVNVDASYASLDFLGYSFRYDRDLHGRDRHYLNIQPSRKSMARAREKVRELTATKRCFMPVVEMIDEVNSWLGGWTTAISYSASVPADPQRPFLSIAKKLMCNSAGFFFSVFAMRSIVGRHAAVGSFPDRISSDQIEFTLRLRDRPACALMKLKDRLR